MTSKKFALSLLLTATMLLPVSVGAAPFEREVPPRMVVVNGNCRQELVPDQASLNMVAIAQHPKDLRVAVNDAVKIYEAARTKIQGLKLRDAEFTTSEYNVQPVYDWANNKQTLRGYQARIALRVSSTDIDRMGDVMALAADARMQEVGMWQLIVSPGKFKEAQKSCLATAVQDARNNAERMAQAAGSKLGPVYLMTQEGAFQPPAMPMVKMMRAEAMAAGDAVQAPSIDAGKQEITISVQASFLLE